ncbi:hypothetical protein BY996DRAFT_6489240 [Phakopsora pachyrhizi]|nr:hypothetical protein BY996DRAFT_6489240 [Phakopsora pachyrhizi]
MSSTAFFRKKKLTWEIVQAGSQRFDNVDCISATRLLFLGRFEVDKLAGDWPEDA